MKVFVKSALTILVSVMLVSCGSFGQGLLEGLASYGLGGYSGYSTYSCNTNSENIDYLLDPNYAIAKTNSQIRELQQVSNYCMESAISQTNTKLESAYQTFRKYNKKPDGSDYSREEWTNMVGQALAEIKNEESTNSTPTETTTTSNKRTSYYKEHYGQKRCNFCNGTGVCSSCDGKGYFYSNFSNEKIICPNCYRKEDLPLGICGHCFGSGEVFGSL